MDVCPGSWGSRRGDSRIAQGDPLRSSRPDPQMPRALTRSMPVLCTRLLFPPRTGVRRRTRSLCRGALRPSAVRCRAAPCLQRGGPLPQPAAALRRARVFAAVLPALRALLLPLLRRPCAPGDHDCHARRRAPNGSDRDVRPLSGTTTALGRGMIAISTRRAGIPTAASRLGDRSGSRPRRALPVLA